METKLRLKRPVARVNPVRLTSRERQERERVRLIQAKRNAKPVPMQINSQGSIFTTAAGSAGKRSSRTRPSSRSPTRVKRTGGVKKKTQETVRNERGRVYAVKSQTVGKVSCSRVLTFQQKGAICWFTAIITSLFFSQYCRVVLRKHARQMANNQIAGAMLELIKGYDSGKVSRRVLEHMQPHQFLQDLRSTRSNLFDSTLNGSSEAHYSPYVQKILGFLKVPHLGIGVVNGKVMYSGFNVDLPLDAKLWPSAMKTQSPRGTFVDTNNPEIILIHKDAGEEYVQNFWGGPVPAIGQITGYSPNNHNKTIRYNGRSYVLDSCILGGEVRTPACSVAHAIAGVTCNNKRFIYNGWTARSGDPAMSGSGGSVISDMPCSLMPADWATNAHFCINTAACKMNVATKNKIGKELCFNGVARSTVMYIRRDLARLAGYKVITRQVKR